MQNILNVTWRYRFPECRRFTVLLDGENVTECINIMEMNCTVRNLTTDQQHTIMIYAESETLVKSELFSFTPNQEGRLLSCTMNFVHTKFNSIVTMSVFIFLYSPDSLNPTDRKDPTDPTESTDSQILVYIGLAVAFPTTLVFVVALAAIPCVIYGVKRRRAGTDK